MSNNALLYEKSQCGSKLPLGRPSGAFGLQQSNAAIYYEFSTSQRLQRPRVSLRWHAVCSSRRTGRCLEGLPGIMVRRVLRPLVCTTLQQFVDT